MALVCGQIMARDASLLHTGGDLVFESKDGRQVSVDQVIDLLEDVILIKQFLEDSSLTEEWLEYKMVNKIKGK